MQPIRVFLEGSPAFASSTPVQVGVSTAAILLIGSNQFRKGLIVQNTGTTILKLNFGTVAPTQTVYHVALSACTGADDGLGGAYFEGNWVGAVQIISSGVGGTCVLTEFTVGDPNWNLASFGGNAAL